MGKWKLRPVIHQQQHRSGDVFLLCLAQLVPPGGKFIGVLDVPSHRHLAIYSIDGMRPNRMKPRILQMSCSGDEAIMHRDGDRLAIEPIRKRGLLALLQTMTPLDERFPEIEDRPSGPDRCDALKQVA